MAPCMSISSFGWASQLRRWRWSWNRLVLVRSGPRIRIRDDPVSGHLLGRPVVQLLVYRKQTLTLVQMKQKWANGGGFGFPNPLCQPLRHVPEDNSPVDFPSTVQCAEDSVSDRDRHLGWLVRVDDWNQEFEKPLLPVIPAVAHGIPVLGVDLMHKPPFVVALHPVGQTGTSSREVVSIAPQVCRPELGAISDCAVKDVRLLRLHHLPDQLLPLQRPWAFQQPFTPHCCQIMLELLQMNRILRNAWRYIPERDHSCLWGCHLGDRNAWRGNLHSETFTRNPTLGILHSLFSANLYRKSAGSACNRMWE